MSKALLWVGGIFLPIGLAMLGAAWWSFSEDRAFNRDALSGSGTVVALTFSRDSDGDTSWRPVVEFADRDGATHRFTGRVGSNPPSYHEGEQVNVIYNGWAPGDARIDSFFDRHFGMALFGGMGTIFSLVGGGLLYAVVRRRKMVARLKREGQPIEAKFLEVFLDRSTTINGRHPYRLACQAMHPATGKLVRFDSDHIWADPTELIGNQPIRVLIDPRRPRDHYVDIEKWVDIDG